MKTRTLSLTIDAAPERVYAFASNPENLPRWVPFFRSVAFVDGDWVAETEAGRVVFEFVHDNDLGVLDHTLTLADGEAITNPMRVVANGEGSELLFTLMQRPGVTDAAFAEDAERVIHDLQTLKRLLEAPAG